MTLTLTQTTITQRTRLANAAAAAAAASPSPSPSNHTVTDRVRLRIDDRWYDLTAWQNQHPGGAHILQFLNNQDATDAFYSLHSKEAIGRLHRMSSTPVTSSDAAVIPEVQAFRHFRQQLEKDGWFQRSMFWDLFYFLHIYALAALGTWLALNGYPVFAIACVGLAMQQAGWVAHDFVHGRGEFSYVAGRLTGALVNGFSSTWWSNKHNTHHCFTNHVGVDEDIQNEPVFHLFFPSSATKDVYFRRFQHLYFVPVASFLYVSWRIQSIQRAVSDRNWSEIVMISLNYLWLALCFPVWFSAACILLGGALVAIIVTASHQSEEMYDAASLKNEGSLAYNFVRTQFGSTRDAVTFNFFTEWLWGGMQYQLEHHLFPTMPKYYYAKVVPLVKEFARQNNLPYKSESEWDLLRRNYETLKYYAQPL